ncbi:MAG: hypothetical protein KUG82_07055 [Pseudomonadales bacterium]|nr:hypothetical protein [Pseudomonadales bacterium]
MITDQVVSIFALFGCGLVYLAAILRWSWCRQYPLAVRWGVAIVGVIALVVPVSGESLLILIRGFSGDFSVGTLLLCSISIASILFVGFDFKGVISLPNTRDRQLMLMVTVIMSLVLYPFALGWGAVDTYGWGYGNLGFALGLLLVCLAAWWARFYLTVIWLSLSVVAYQLRIYESNNVWDYLIDPFLILYAMGYLVSCSVSKLMKLRVLNTA